MKAGQKFRVIGNGRGGAGSGTIHYFEIGDVVTFLKIHSDGSYMFERNDGLNQWLDADQVEPLEVEPVEDGHKEEGMKQKYVYEYDLIDADTKKTLQRGFATRECARDEKRCQEMFASAPKMQILQRKLAVVEEKVIR